MSEQIATGVPPIAEETVAQLARMAGFNIAPERLATVTDRLRDLYRLAADLDGVDLEGVASSAVYEPAWSEIEGAVTA
jgi:Asp-tRNA(Asn)/Glu-tRNA(Gln) amidotransferase C subunit